MLLYLTMHEALPGHYTQFEHANNLKPSSRRVLRVLLGNGPYVEGWGEYGVKEMEDAGYANHDPRFVLMVQKIRLRVIANAILDIRMQSRNMTDQEALDLMENKAFQTAAEAQGKLRRAKLTAGQLITYYVGYHQWINLRDGIQQQQGSAFSLKQLQRYRSRRRTAAHPDSATITGTEADRSLRLRRETSSCTWRRRRALP